ncbi:NAD(P)/FAD-dependent oxidoreductase [Haloarchaeobius sp. HME9146]|uniref:NAD(P)/FAD-dependent oxidoreductase n=1 Tax=Haloarchaeobius sp. HME9146 TaxID=2978732 RepID=UPI0021BFF419|nr:NAD(P)/FAD-dependent oxidoreductase [Haloarchaeobius sp. HME9146]MCT9097194.1 NAD(P)/FAD-dependent oxidoreductase [Haloarchaeobius sp. HME9146]
MKRVDVAIVGGGPAGTCAAMEAAYHGADALVLEKGVPRADREGLGPDSTDAAGMLDYWVDIMDFDPDEFPEGIVLQELDAVDFVGPTETTTLRSTGIDSSYDRFGYTFQRARMDDWLREQAEEEGAAYEVGVSVKSVDSDLDSEYRHTVHLADGEDVEARYLVLADGPQRTVTIPTLDQFMPEGKSVSDVMSPPTANHIAYQEHREVPEEVFEETHLKFWWGWMPGETAYPWIFPNDGNVARIGLTMPIGMTLDDVEDPDGYRLLEPEDESLPRAGEYIRRLLEIEYGDEYDIEEDFPLVEDRGKSGGTETYPISSTKPIESPTGAGIAVAGGAMGTTSAFHEGGYHVACRTGKIAGRLAAVDSLDRYNEVWRNTVGDELLRNVTFADIVAEYGPDDWDRTFEMTNKLISDGSDGSLIKSRLSGGLSGMKLLAKYKRTKRSLRKNGYFKLTEDDYTV